MTWSVFLAIGLFSQQHEKMRLKRIYERQEAARKLVNNVEILLYQKSLTAVERNDKPHTRKMECAELLATAHCVARDFKTLTCQMSKDFAINDRNNHVAQKHHAAGKQVKMDHLQKDQQHSLAPISPHPENNDSNKNTINKNNSNKSIAFTVGFDDESQLQSPAPKVLEAQKRKGQCIKPTSVLLQEKQRLADERRAVSQCFNCSHIVPCKLITRCPQGKSNIEITAKLLIRLPGA